MKPEDALEQAQRALNQEQWDKAAAYASLGILSALVGGAQAFLPKES